MRRGFLALAALGCALALLAVSAGATTAPLPGGTSFEVTVRAPAAGAVLPEATPFTVEGRAAIGAAAPVAGTALITAIDVSGSTFNPVSTTACGNQNPTHDPVGNTVLDCELSAARALNDTAVTQGTVAQAGVIGFAGRIVGAPYSLPNEAAILDVGPGAGQQNFTPPATNAGGNPDRDVNEVLGSAYNRNISGTIGFPAGDQGVGFTQFGVFTSPGNTNYYAVVTQIRNLAALAPAGLTKVAVILSDGDSTVGGPANESVSSALAGISGIKIFTFAIGNAASCNGTPGASNFGTLQQIANATGATCTHIANPALAADVVPDAIGSQITAPRLSHGGATYDVPDGPAIPPFNGPGTLDFAKTYPAADATPGTHTVCARATGTDGGGSSTLDECVDVTVLARPVVDAGPALTVPEGSSIDLEGSATSGALSWSWTGGTGTCLAANGSTATPTVTCGDDGGYSFSLSADDGVNAPVTDAMTLQVTNVAPTPALALSPGPHPLAQPVSAHASISDPGTDTFDCSLDWGDGTIDLFPAAGGACDRSHSYAAGGDYSVTVTVTDDDGGAGTDSQAVAIDAPPTASAADASGTEGSPIALAGTADDDHGAAALHYHWTIAPGAGTDAGAACSLAGDGTLAPVVTCNDDGIYDVALTADDTVNPPVTAVSHVTVANAAPAVSAPAAAGPLAQTAPVTLSFAFGDAGSNDTHACSIAWGDGSSSAGAVSGGTCTGSHAYAAGGTYTATGTVTDDDGDAGSASTLVDVAAPPVVVISGGPGGAGYTGIEGTPVALSASLAGALPGTTVHWTAAPGADVDPGATCAFGDASSASTNVTCTDDGHWTLTLTADDHLNPPVAGTAALVLANAAPVLSLTATASGYAVHAVGSISDAGSNDTHACSFSWSDGTTTAAAASGGSCASDHTFAAGTHAASVTVTATDDDGASDAKTASLTFNRPPACTAVAPSLATLWPPSHDLRLIVLGGATDPDGDALAYTITGVRQDEPTNGLGDGDTGPYDAQVAAAGSVWLRAERSGKGDGRVYTIAYTVSDGVASCSGTATVGVAHSASRSPVLTPGASYNSLG